MTRQSTLAPVVLAMALGLAACGESGSGGESGAGGSAGTGGSAGSGGTADTGGDGGTGGMANDECNRICESPCVGEYLPPGSVDDCLRSCRMGFFVCIPDLIAALECIEMIACDILADPCLAQSEALTTCLVGGG